MEHLKKINPTPLFFILIMNFSCSLPERDCQNFRSGKFYSETMVEGIKYKSTFWRNNTNIQIEEFEGKLDSSNVRWVNNCEMVLSPINPRSIKEKKNILIKILSTTDTSYTYEYSYLGENIKLKAKAIKIE
tara:strand:+ start:5212 stop:5604 length:393 start_codon:yes stop_codon:yes gene_type:complete